MLLTMATWNIIHMAYSQPCGTSLATCIQSMRLKRQPRVYYTWLTCRDVFSVTRGTVAMWISWTRGKLYISQQPDLLRRAHVAIYTWLTVCHVYVPYTRGNLQVVNCKFFCATISTKHNMHVCFSLYIYIYSWECLHNSVLTQCAHYGVLYA